MRALIPPHFPLRHYRGFRSVACFHSFPFVPQALVETLHKTLSANSCLLSSVSIPTFAHPVHCNMHPPNLLPEAVSYLAGPFVRGILPLELQRLVWALSRFLPPFVALDLVHTLLRRIDTFRDPANLPAINPTIQPRSPDLRRQRCHWRNRRQPCNRLGAPPPATFAFMPVAQRRNRNPLPALLYIPASCKAAVEDRTLCPPSPSGMFFSSLPFAREEDVRVWTRPTACWHGVPERNELAEYRHARSTDVLQVCIRVLQSCFVNLQIIYLCNTAKIRHDVWINMRGAEDLRYYPLCFFRCSEIPVRTDLAAVIGHPYNLALIPG